MAAGTRGADPTALHVTFGQHSDILPRCPSSSIRQGERLTCMVYANLRRDWAGSFSYTRCVNIINGPGVPGEALTVSPLSRVALIFCCYTAFQER
ncbi:Uncharacterized protein PBTT_06937 [Plasmodiophora brassicae]